MDKKLTKIIKQNIELRLNHLHTVTLAKITAVNEITINCKPVINRVVNDQSVELPEFAEVPLFTLQGGNNYIHMPVQVDDYCLLLISERCFDKWYIGQDFSAPLERRKFDYSDAIALVGVNPQPKAIPLPSDGRTYNIGDNLIKGDHEHEGNIKHEGNYELSGDVKHQGDYKQTGNLFVAGNVEIKGNLMVDGNIMCTGILTVPTIATGGFVPYPDSQTPPTIDNIIVKDSIVTKKAVIGDIDFDAHKHRVTTSVETTTTGEPIK